MSQTEIALPTPDGDARAYVFRPEGKGPWPAAVLLMDAPAIRPGLFQMCERLAGHGYYVLLPDLFWRLGPYEPFDVKGIFGDETKRGEFFRLISTVTDAERQMRDVKACLDYLAKQPDVKGDKVGVTGYCMGGGIALRAAIAFPDRIVAAGAFHPGNLATDAPDSPHLSASKIKAKVYVGGADEDPGFPSEQADRLREALTAAGVENEVAIYAGARHGFAPPDTVAHHPEGSERHWRELVKLFDSTLKGAAVPA